MLEAVGAKSLAAPTAGNAGAALSAYGARAGMPVFVAMPRDTPTSIVEECRDYGAEVELVEGVITEILPERRFRVRLDNGHDLIAYTAGKMLRNRIRSIAGDRVHVEVSPYDLDKGRVVFRERSGPPFRMNQRRFFRR